MKASISQNHPHLRSLIVIDTSSQAYITSLKLGCFPKNPPSKLHIQHSI
uniref:Uncharacterized protein n=1 Tax=Rhizophora mucronata TaxID=61149 RepID=A0A2P2N7X2_RHIMU